VIKNRLYSSEKGQINYQESEKKSIMINKREKRLELNKREESELKTLEIEKAVVVPTGTLTSEGF
jgi:hypothetical protein